MGETEAGVTLSQVPGEEGESRDIWQQPEKVLDVIGVKTGMTVGEVGAGNGYFTFWIAQRVGPTGLVYANDIDQKALRNIADGARQRKIENIITLRGETANPLFSPDTLDLAIMVYVFHELVKPVELLRNLKPSLKPGAPLVILERDPEKIHSSSGHFYHKDRLLELVAEAGLELTRIETFLPRDNIYIFRETRPSSPPTKPSIGGQEGSCSPASPIMVSVTKGAWSLFVLYRVVGDKGFLSLIADFLRKMGCDS